METKRNYSVTILRLVAALMVLSGHMSYITGTEPAWLWGQQIHAMGVKIFFLLGGALITKSWLSDPHPIRYIIKRFFRIWPPLAVCVLAITFLVGPFISSYSPSEYYTSATLWNYLNNLRFYINYALPGLFENNPYPHVVNGSLWTLPVEVTIYILIPFLSALLVRLKENSVKFIAAYGTAVFACGIQIYITAMSPEKSLVIYATDWVSAMEIIPYYFIGMAYTITNGQKRLNFPVSVFLMLIFSCFNLSGIAYLMLFYPIFSYFILSLAFGTEIYIKNIPFQNLEISYGIYLWGFFIQQSVVQLAAIQGWNLSFPVILMICTVLSILMGYLSCVLVERPAQNMCKSILSKIPQAKSCIQKQGG